MRNNKIKVWELSLLFALCVCLCQATVEAGRHSALSEKIVRLHVIAASDEPEAQALKMRVRDAALAEIEPLLASARTATEAEAAIEKSSECILAAAREAAEGESVELIFGRENYTYRETASYALPAGEYSSLRIILGGGEGHNWWGVIFPQLDSSGGYAEAVNLLSEDELALICEEDGFELRFKFLEALEKLRLWFEKR